MYFNVPQYIDVEDKIAFQLTAKQLGWFALGGLGMFFAWSYGSKDAFIVWSIVIILAVVAFAFYKPYGITLAAFIGYGFLFMIRPKKFIWRRFVQVSDHDSQTPTAKPAIRPVKTLENAESMAEILDSKRF